MKFFTSAAVILLTALGGDNGTQGVFADDVQRTTSVDHELETSMGDMILEHGSSHRRDSGVAWPCDHETPNKRSKKLCIKYCNNRNCPQREDDDPRCLRW
eukprot:CAMPEP_0172464484 /NCGR_PEP_ID=MMETSP1065-20121228/50579_1 /TAXON_ID=265537 /ORGANISM="Amphiprora paludosa, Strain CCMP125" /LENGTH=99 /DNA_ID=CAMNT_0013220725 /DNA_START=91 /DNA_END=387 /DNA_ORIENTATION=+